MDNIRIINVRPNQNTNGSYIGYSAILKPTDHTISGNFTATNDETKEAFADNKDWQGFKKLVLKRIAKDVSTFNTQNSLK